MSSDFIPGLVSVIIPTYNRDKFLKEAVLSLYGQTYRPIECIVVDDGSTDKTQEVLEVLKQLNSSEFMILNIIQANAGPQVARNIGTASSKGEFIQYLDSDDLLYPNKIAKHVAYLRQSNDCDGVFGDWRSGLPDNSVLIEAYASDDMLVQFLGDRCIANLSFMMRREIVKKIGDWDPAIKRNQEIDFHIRGLLEGGRFHYQPGSTGLWRQHQGTRIANTTNLSDILFFFQKMERMLKEQNLFTEKIREIMASQYLWRISQYKEHRDKNMAVMMKEALRLKPDVGFFKNRKLQLLAWLLGQRLAFTFWVRFFEK